MTETNFVGLVNPTYNNAFTIEHTNRSNPHNDLLTCRKAFTLAEVVVVMAILGVMMAAFAPVVTKRTVGATSSMFKGFRVDQGHTGIYYGTVGDTKVVTIGDTSVSTDATFHPKELIVSSLITPTGSSSEIVTPAIGFGYREDDTKVYTGQLLVVPTQLGHAAPRISGSDAGHTEAVAPNGSVIVGGKPNYDYPKGELKNVTAIGYNACDKLSSSLAYSNFICVGSNSGPTSSPAYSNGIYIGDKTVAYDSAKIYFGVSSLKTIAQNAASSTTSDKRLKNVGKKFLSGIEQLKNLDFYHYTLKEDVDKTLRVGVIAQDLQKVFPDAVGTESDGYLFVRKDYLFFAALNAIKEMFERITDNSTKIENLEKENLELRAKLIELEKLVKGEITDK